MSSKKERLTLLHTEGLLRRARPTQKRKLRPREINGLPEVTSQMVTKVD